MSNFHQKSLFLMTKFILLFTVIVGSMQLITGCDSQSLSSDNHMASNDVNSQTSDTDKDIVEIDVVSPKNITPTNASMVSEEQSTKGTNLPDEKVVGLSGYQKLSFGQVITPKILSDLGLTREGGNNEQCYYVSNEKLNYVDEKYGKRASVLYQIINDKVALITIQDPTMSLYTGINVGDSVKEVMKAHNNDLIYEVDKYAVDGYYYNLIANVNFEVIKENEQGEWLKDEDVKLDNKGHKMPIQIEYHIKGGQKLNDYQIKATEWTADNKNLLKGQVESIDIGIPEAIYLVEGCS
ncbi:hypothetical protein [Psychrobacter sp. P2G3]|uniref:hypothetical protein n=1 Tax=Psychrobacter sp. P2G3 TaxID=1699622 RepID=UPI00078C545F|nr:hypothetical protein [Psychrobacter sp. P2G3]AMN49772.1 hypothetical protein AK823_07710 [Psychrobacter sp. P2G3]